MLEVVGPVFCPNGLIPARGLLLCSVDPEQSISTIWKNPITDFPSRVLDQGARSSLLVNAFFSSSVSSLGIDMCPISARRTRPEGCPSRTQEVSPRA